MSILIRDAVAADFPVIAEITASVYIGEGFSPESADGVLRDVEARAAATTLLVAVDEADGSVVGAVSLVPWGSPYRQIGYSGELEVRLLAVNPKTRGQGTGELLMRALMERAQAQPIVLSTQPTMEAAQRLYLRLGFRRVAGRDWVRASGRTMLVYQYP